MKGPKVLAIGIDSLPPSLLDTLVDEGALPNIARLMAGDVRSDLRDEMAHGSGMVWPTFVTGRSPDTHQAWEHLEWDEASMRLVERDLQRLRPFWADLVADGCCVGVFNVPFSPMLGLSTGFEMVEWGSHFVIRGEMGVGPLPTAQIVGGAAPHPFQGQRHRPLDIGDSRGRDRNARGCLEGVHRRAELAETLLGGIQTDLAIVVFDEFHEAAHYLFHEIDPSLAVLAQPGLAGEAREGPGLRDILSAIDQAVGRLADLAQDSVVVFSLHGMRPGVGMPSLLPPLLEHWGYAQPTGAGSRGARDRLRGLLPTLKRVAPREVKRLYHRLSPSAIQQALARPDRVLALDWSATEAFSLPTEEHGFVRLNLRGREAEGIVDPSRAQATLTEIADRLEAATTDGRRLVDGFVWPKGSGEREIRQSDLIVHWSEMTRRLEVPIDGTGIRSRPHRPEASGQHVGGGFVIWSGSGDALSPSLEPLELVDCLTAAVRR